MVLALAGALAACGRAPSSSSSSAAAGRRTTTTTSAAPAGPTIPFLGIEVHAAGKPVTDGAGRQITITDPGGHALAVSGVTVTSVVPTVEVQGRNTATPAATAGLRAGDEIWGIGEVESSQLTPVPNGAVLATFLRNYAVSGHTDKLYLYYYDPVSGHDYESDAPQLAPAEVAGSAAAISCTSAPGC